MTDLTPGAQFTADLIAAVNRATSAGLSAKRMAEIAADFTEDLRDLADDSQWPDETPQSVDEARAQLDRKGSPS